MEPLASLAYYSNSALLLGRIVLGCIFLYHGWTKVLHAKGFYKGLGFWETFWSLAVMLGFLAHVAGAALAVVMVGATYMKAWKWKVPFVGQDKTGYELDLALFAIGIILLILGGGSVSLDALIWVK